MTAEKRVLRNKTRRKMLRLYLLLGIKALKQRDNRLILIGFSSLFLLLRQYVLSRVSGGIWGAFLQDAYDVVFLLFGFLLLPGILLIMGSPKKCIKTADDLCRAGFVNSAGECPILLSSGSDPDEPDLQKLEFDSSGLPLSVWEDERDKLAAALNVHILSIEQGTDNRHIILHVICSDHQLPSILVWDNSAWSREDFKLLLGESVTGKVWVDLNRIPHILIGGSTGSGKTIFLRSLLLQCILKGAEVIVADFKGIDFHHVWKSHCEIITEPAAFEQKLDMVLAELRRRKTLFSEHDFADILEYNAHDGGLPHIILACDELSELLDKTGVNKEEKERISRIEAALSTFARQGRAFGIHLLLATQRPDANVLPGQIKNNMDCRICGRADHVLSQIILDNTSAADVIPKNATGRFIMNDGTILQGYYVDDEMVAHINSPGKDKAETNGSSY